jgi:hypothetical protein
MQLSDETPFQRLAEARDITGHVFRLRFMEEVIRVNIQPDKVAVQFQCYKLIERGNGWLVADKGIRLVVSTKTDGVWSEPDGIQVWGIDPDFVPFEIDTPQGKTPREYNEKVAREKICYRPGNGSRLGQRDSYSRNIDRQIYADAVGR